MSSKDNDVYELKCQPTNDEITNGETTLVSTKKQIIGPNNLTAKVLFNSPFFISLLGILGLIILFYFINNIAVPYLFEPAKIASPILLKGGGRWRAKLFRAKK
jgi:hypothetical protein